MSVKSQSAVDRVVTEHGRIVVDHLVGRSKVPVNVFSPILGFENEGSPIDAIAISCFKGLCSQIDPSVVEQIAQVPTAGRAANLSSSQRGTNGIHFFLFDALECPGKAGPSRPGTELVFAVKEGCLASGTDITSLVGRRVGVQNGGFLALRPAPSQDIVLGPAQQVGPFPLRVLDGISLGPALVCLGSCHQRKTECGHGSSRCGKATVTEKHSSVLVVVGGIVALVVLHRKVLAALGYFVAIIIRARTNERFDPADACNIPCVLWKSRRE
mmetsp:Transcript_20575/g.51178  ORF Transcript_20575/g.51178 Transcript_20575/m.51178 type:complete len:270 (-) Transcript_20575:181-990(-)